MFFVCNVALLLSSAAVLFTVRLLMISANKDL